MVTVKRISKNELPRVVEIAFRGDTDLFKKYHQANSDEETSIKNTVDRIIDTATIYDLTFYKVIFEKKVIGYFVVAEEPKLLYSFGINIKYRTKQVIGKWWEVTKKQLPKEFKVMLYKKNTRAIDFMQRNGMKVINEDPTTVTLKN
jgi:hypothetical protein